MPSSPQKFADFIKTKKLDPRRILAASHKLETLTLADRKIKMAKRKPKEGEEKKDVSALGKPKSGRPVTPRAMEAALAGKTISGPTKQRMLRAVNLLLTQKKQEAVDLRVLF
jgi:hypothetical protein